MHDFFDMQSLSAILQEVIEKLDGGNDDAAIDFATHVFTTHVPCIATPLCTLYTEENAVIRYAQQFLKYNQELGIVDAVESLAHHTARFDYADTPMLTPESALSVLNRVCEMFPYAEKVIGDNPIEILLIESQHEPRNGESTAIFTLNGMHGIICIYQLQGNCIAAPEHIFLHELLFVNFCIPVSNSARVFFCPGATNWLRFSHILDPGGVFMEKTIIIHCTYSEDGDEIAEIIQESFRLFLQKELLALAIEPRV